MKARFLRARFLRARFLSMIDFSGGLLQIAVAGMLLKKKTIKSLFITDRELTGTFLNILNLFLVSPPPLPKLSYLSSIGLNLYMSGVLNIFNKNDICPQKRSKL